MHWLPFLGQLMHASRRLQEDNVRSGISANLLATVLRTSTSEVAH